MNAADALLAAIEAMPHGVSVFDASQRLMLANPAFWRLAGVDGATMPAGTPARDVHRLLAYRGLLGPGDPEAHLAGALAMDRTRLLLRRLRAADGRQVHEVLSVPLPEGGYLLCAQDVTPLVQSEAEAQRRARLAETVLSHLSSGVVAYGPDHRIRLVNGAFETLTGLPPGTLRPGMAHAELLDAQVARGEFVNADAAAELAERTERDRRHHSSKLRERPGGEVLRFDSHPLPDGGFVVEVDDITALKRAEEEATRRAALLDGVLEALPYGVCIFGPDLRAQRVNAAYARLMEGSGVRIGETAEEVIARREREGEYDTAIAARLRARLLAGPADREVLRRERPNGTVIESRRASLPDGGLIVVYTEITALHRAEEAARQRAALLDGVVSAMPHGVCVFGPDRRVAMFNAAYARIMEGAPAAIGDHIDELTTRRVAAGEYGGPYDSPAHRALREGVMEERVRQRPNGTVMAVRVAPLPDGGLVSVLTDVTALHRAEQAARERAEVLDSVLESLPDGVVVYGPDRRARLANAAYGRILGESAARIGEDLDALLRRRVASGETTAEEAAQLRARRLAADPVGAEPITRIRPDGRALTSRSARLPDGGHVAVITDVTALHRAEEALRQRAAELETSFAAIRHGIALFGPDHRLVAFNERASSLTRMPRESLVAGRPFAELVREQVARGTLTPEQCEAVLRLDRRRPHRYERTLPDGRIVEVLSDPAPDGGFIVTYSDVTALHQAEAELRRRAAMLEASFGAMRHGIAIFDRDRRLTAVNGRTSALTGLPEELQTLGVTLDELFEEQVARGIVSPAAAARGRAIDRTTSNRYRRYDDDGKVIEVFSDPTPDGGFVITFTDVTPLHQAEAELGRRAAMQDAMLATMRHGLILYGPDRRVQARNAKTSELTGIPPESLVPGRLIDDILDEQVGRGEMPAAFAAELKACDRSRPLHYSRARPGGRHLDIVSEPTPEGGFVITYSDVTEDRSIRAELERARAAAEAASEAKSRFLATMSHELRTPLAAVIGFSDAIAVEQDRARIADYAAAVNEAGRHLLQLVDDILDVARSQTGALAAAREPFAPADVLREALAAIEATAASRGLALSACIAGDLPLLRGDPLRLRQILDKLLSNALKFTPDGGQVRLSAEADGTGLSIRVADTGIGIPYELRERVFEPFTQLDNALSRRFQGSGLGLHLARALTTALGGTLTLEDADGPGVVAVLRFPSSLLQPVSALAGPLPA